MTKIAVNGAAGRMGNRILALAAESKEFKVAGKFDQGYELSSGALKKEGKGVLIDFSGPAGTQGAIADAQSAGWGLVIGTTGLDAAIEKKILAASKKIAIVRSSNMSVGVNLVLEVLRLLATRLPNNFDIHITEAHHCHKKDAPSGTALMLAKEIASAKKWNMAPLQQSWKAGKFDTEKIKMKVIREGEIVGDHNVSFSGPAETIEVAHYAKSRDTFARGALLAASFLSKKKKGLYSMADVLGK